MEVLKLLREGRSKGLPSGSPSARHRQFPRANIREKLGVTARKQAAERAAELGVLSDER